MKQCQKCGVFKPVEEFNKKEAQKMAFKCNVKNAIKKI